MKSGFLSLFARPGQVEDLAPGVVPRAEAAAAGVTQAVRGFTRRAARRNHRKSAISLRVDPEVLSWFKAQGPGYQTRMNSVLRAYKDASS